MAGGGFLGLFYYMGIIKFLNENYKNKEFICFGSSAGSFAATIFLLIKYDLYSYDFLLNKINEFLNKLIKNTYFSVPFMCCTFMENFINNIILLDDNNLKIIFDKLFISITEINNGFPKNILIKPISKNQLIKMLISSSLIPIIIGFNKNYIDGSFTNNQPYINKNKTLKINCIYSYNSDIYPSKWINLFYIFKIPNQSTRNFLINLGYNDIKQFFS